jgi:hypothetical protein
MEGHPQFMMCMRMYSNPQEPPSFVAIGTPSLPNDLLHDPPHRTRILKNPLLLKPSARFL